MSDQRRATTFDVMAEMSRRDMPEFKMAPLGNILRATAGKRGTQITIGWPGNVVGRVLDGTFVGGLILIDRAKFAEVEAELNAASK